jgi:hypothetical protein
MLVAGTLLALVAMTAGADTITFSGPVMSDYDAPYTVFDAVIDYSYAAGVLTLDIQNDTASPYAYTLSVLCFNVSSDVTAMSILDDGGLTNTSLTTNAHGDGFGVFGYKFDLGKGNNGILAGNSETVTFNVTGSGLDTSDFFNGLSSGDKPQVATIHFTRGPDDDSTWVTPGLVPEPASISLLGMALVGLVVRRVRNHAA